MVNGDSASSNVLSYVGKLGEINHDWTSQYVNTEVVLSVGIVFAMYVFFLLI